LFDQQQSGLESVMLSDAIEATFKGLVDANQLVRQPAPLSKLTVGLKCGGSDGFSGLSANPALGHVSDMLAALGGRSILSEFPELCGVEQNLIDRCADPGRRGSLHPAHAGLQRARQGRLLRLRNEPLARQHPGRPHHRRHEIRRRRTQRAATAPCAAFSTIRNMPRAPASIFSAPPAAMSKPSPPRSGAGANIVLFTTGLGTPTGNPITPVLKVATNTRLAEHMSDIIDIDTGAIIRGEAKHRAGRDSMLETIVEVASGTVLTKAELLGQNDFIPWKRGVSL
jgi:altronate hydrolase